MFNVYTLTNAMPVAMFGMFALWAAASTRHWFLRTAVVAAAILVTLLIPAYEVVIMLTVETAVVVAGIAIWRRRRTRESNAPDAAPTSEPFRPRLSMETLMLCVVIVAVVTTLAARWPAIRPEEWYQFALNGAHSGIIALLCVWLVCGRARWWIRLAAAPPLVLLLTFTLISLRWAGYIVSYWFRITSRPIDEYILMAFRDLWPGTLSWLSTLALGMAILCTWLFLMTRAGWFDPFQELQSAPATPHARCNMRRARLAAIILFGVTAIFPLLLFYKLLTPTSLPVVQLPNPNGYDDFLAAGRIIGPAASRTFQNCDLLTTAQLRAQLDKHVAAFNRLQQGLQKPCRNPFVYESWTAADYHALAQLFNALTAQGEFARRTANLQLELEAYKTLMKLANEEPRGTGTEFYTAVFVNFESDAHTGIWNCVLKYSAREWSDLVAELLQIERSREPWSDRVERQRVIEENSGWERHLTTILTNWSGAELFEWQTNAEKRSVAHLRMLILKLALRDYEFDHDQLPAALDELVPEYLPAVPDDPFGSGAFQYRPNGEGYLLYSFGPDLDDDGGQPLVNDKGDLTDALLFPPPQPPTQTPSSQPTQ